MSGSVRILNNYLKNRKHAGLFFNVKADGSSGELDAFDFITIGETGIDLV